MGWALTTRLRGLTAAVACGMCGVAGRAAPRIWLSAAAASGIAPLIIGAWLGVPGHQWASAALLFVLFIGAVREHRPALALSLLMVAFASHSAVAIAIVASGPPAPSLFPGGDAYWRESLEWIQTGRSAEADAIRWLPAHIQLAAAAVVLGSATLGLMPLYEGFYEVDLMNYYVGRLLTMSERPVLALGLGWHVWSLARGVCFALLLYEVVSLTLSVLTSRVTSDRRARLWRCSLAGGFFALDCALKFFLMEPVRRALLDGLRFGS